MALKNFWSLQTGEVISADLIKKHLGKNYEIFIPLNNQLKDYDLVLMNQKTKKIVTIQVKESREHHLGVGNGLFRVSRQKVLNKAVDFYIFLVYAVESDKNKMKMRPRALVIPSEILLEKSQNKKESKGNYTYYFKIQKDVAYDDREGKKSPTDYSKYIDNFEILRI